MPTEGLCDLALALLDDSVTGEFFRKVGIHGDIGLGEDQKISRFVEDYVSRNQWEKPDPSNLIMATVLARQIADGGISRDDEKATLDFINDKRGDGLDLQAKRRPLTVSEALPVLKAFC